VTSTWPRMRNGVWARHVSSSSYDMHLSSSYDMHVSSSFGSGPPGQAAVYCYSSSPTAGSGAGIFFLFFCV
jgi:hypothetical protein